MLNRAVAILLLFAMTGTTCSRFFICAGFSLNKKYIVSTFCENKNRPWLHCNGKCYLMKKLRQSEEKQKSESRGNQKENSQEAVCERMSGIKFYTQLLRLIVTPYHVSYLDSPPSPITQPPQ